MNRNILVAEDDRDVRELLKTYLDKEGFCTYTAENGQKALELWKERRYSLALIDLMMPILDGYQVIEEVRKTSNIPILILSALIEEQNKLKGFGSGADIYISKPFQIMEVVAQVKALYRRCYMLSTEKQPEKSAVKKCGNLEIDPERFTVKKCGASVNLTATEMKILLYLVSNQGMVVTPLQIFEAISGGFIEGDQNTIHVHIRNLRMKIEEDPSHPTYVTTIRGLGYRFGEA